MIFYPLIGIDPIIIIINDDAGSVHKSSVQKFKMAFVGFELLVSVGPCALLRCGKIEIHDNGMKWMDGHVKE